MMQYSNPYSFEKTDAGGQKFLKHLQNVSTKRYTKHWLYTVLWCRFNAPQQLICTPFINEHKTKPHEKIINNNPDPDNVLWIFTAFDVILPEAMYQSRT